MKLDK